LTVTTVIGLPFGEHQLKDRPPPKKGLCKDNTPKSRVHTETGAEVGKRMTNGKYCDKY
jgi:hypothetical protein